jgi:hypothetical protein
MICTVTDDDNDVVRQDNEASIYDPTYSMSFCVNDGQCTKFVDEYGQTYPGCDCKPGYTGAHCELYSTIQATLAGGEITNNGGNDNGADSAAILFVCFVLGVLFVFLLLVLFMRYRGIREQERRAIDEKVKSAHLHDTISGGGFGRQSSVVMEEVDFDLDFDERDLEEVELL